MKQYINEIKRMQQLARVKVNEELTPEQKTAEQKTAIAKIKEYHEKIEIALRDAESSYWENKYPSVLMNIRVASEQTGIMKAYLSELEKLFK